jgi:hypothetical protein
MKRRAILLLMAMGAALVLSSGAALALNTIRCQQPETFWCEGTEEDDRMLGTDGGGSMVARGGNDVLRGFGGDDYVDGEEGNDRLFGGSGVDSLIPGPGDDASHGGTGSDGYTFWPNAWGHDTITDTAISDDDPLTGNGVSFTSVTEGLTINLVSSEDRPEVTNASGAATLNWSDNVVDRTTGGEGDDTIYGNAAANHIHAMGDYSGWPSGDDTIFAGGGDDTIWVRDLDGNTEGDRVDCGEGTDTVHYERGDVVKHCEIKHRSN